MVGRYDRESTVEIRSSLTLEDTPSGIPGETLPTKEDVELQPEEYPITSGDVLNVEIAELRDRQVPYIAQVQVSSAGYINVPVVGRVLASGLTVPDFEKALVEALRDREVLLDPQVTVNPQFLQRGTYSVFGIGVSAADNAPLRAGTFPIRRPDLRILEAINQVGGLNELVTDIYVFRYVEGSSKKAPPKTEAEESEPAPPKPIEPQGRDLGFPEQSKAQDDAARKAELLDLVLSPSAQKSPANMEPPKEPVPQLDPSPVNPYLWVNDQWVPNPRYQEPPNDGDLKMPDAAAQATSPAVNWARIAGNTHYRVIRVSAEQLRNGDPETNIYIRAGDVLRVVSGEIGVYYVMGQVNRVGSFAFNAEPITLKAAIAAAGGLSVLAWPDRCSVYRRQGMREQLIQVNLDRIFAGQDPDFMIRRGDIINVGTHPFAPFLQRIRSWTLPNPVNNVGYSFTYARNFADIDSFSVRQNPHNEPDRFPALFP